MRNLLLLLLDDHTLFRESLSRLLDTEPDFSMAAPCASIGEALATLRRAPVDVVLLDYDLGEERGSEFLAAAREDGFTGKVLLVTAGLTDADAMQILHQGVSGIFLKHSPPALLAEVIRKVADGETWIDQRCVQALVRAASAEQPGRGDSLSERERDVLRGIFEGLSNKEIGVRMSISEASVKAALQQLFRKTGVRTRSQLVRIALEQYGSEWIKLSPG